MKGITITLIEKTQIGTDGFNAPMYEETEVSVENVLVGEPTSDEITDSLNLYGKRVIYVMAIPKGDEHRWHDSDVILPEPFAGRYHTIGYPTAGIEENIPLSWNKKVRLERIG